MTRTLANQWDDPPQLDNRLLVILLISFSIFCYKLSIFGNFILQNIEVDLYTETLKLALFWLRNGGRLIHRFDLYTGKYGSIFSKTLKMHSQVKSLLKTSILTYIATYFSYYWQQNLDWNITEYFLIKLFKNCLSTYCLWHIFFLFVHV